jgi:hypothetical protein
MNKKMRQISQNSYQVGSLGFGGPQPRTRLEVHGSWFRVEGTWSDGAGRVECWSDGGMVKGMETGGAGETPYTTRERGASKSGQAADTKTELNHRDTARRGRNQ